ncbi:dienelactone hydrolase family protein [Rhodoferax aquaticus]|uniref:Dienelactone hydrolase domain-containing protein n=1 Tax=Rhodoferax aquaticus TaxID=2527691 RepID=A0A515EKJ2_9BURK|nr:dienelactone hydrolase family protein [Rhodoferax aquaticus]QDL53184.1 hypothetical protein EXZ61_02790 [Rhodoferax aquaticus]
MKSVYLSALALAVAQLCVGPVIAQTTTQPGQMAQSASTRSHELVPDVKTNLVTFALPAPAQALQGIGRLQIPTDLSTPEATEKAMRSKVPAVVIVHGTGGMDAKGPMYAQALNAAGIATLEIDLWSPRGLAGGWDGRPKHVKETLPDAFGALAYLASLPRIDAQHIGIMGFSWGGVVSMLTADTTYAGQMAPPNLRFAAHMPYYPICFGYNRVPGYPFKDLTGAPIYILTGADDKYDNDATMCDKQVAALPTAMRAQVRVKVYSHAEHGFNNLDQARSYMDPFHYQGRGGLGGSAPNVEAREDSITQTVQFFNQTLK